MPDDLKDLPPSAQRRLRKLAMQYDIFYGEGKKGFPLSYENKERLAYWDEYIKEPEVNLTVVHKELKPI